MSTPEGAFDGGWYEILMVLREVVNLEQGMLAADCTALGILSKVKRYIQLTLVLTSSLLLLIPSTLSRTRSSPSLTFVG